MNPLEEYKKLAITTMFTHIWTRSLISKWQVDLTKKVLVRENLSFFRFSVDFTEFLVKAINLTKIFGEKVINSLYHTVEK